MQRATALTALNNYRSVGDQGHRPVPKNEIPWGYRMLLIELTDRKVASHDERLKRGVLAGIGPREGGSQDGDGPSASLNCRNVGCCIDPACESAHDYHPLLRKRLGKPRGDPQPLGGRCSGANDGDSRVRQWEFNRASHEEPLRGVLLFNLAQRPKQFLRRDPSHTGPPADEPAPREVAPNPGTSALYLSRTSNRWEGGRNRTRRRLAQGPSW